MLNKKYIKSIILSTLVTITALKGNTQNQSEKDTVNKPKSQWTIDEIRFVPASIGVHETYILSPNITNKNCTSFDMELSSALRKGNSDFVTHLGLHLGFAKGSHSQRYFMQDKIQIEPIGKESNTLFGFTISQEYKAHPIVSIGMGIKSGHIQSRLEREETNVSSNIKMIDITHKHGAYLKAGLSINVVVYQSKKKPYSFGFKSDSGITGATVNKHIMPYTSIGLFVIGR